MTDNATTPITLVPAGPAALDALAAAVGRGKAVDPFARVVVVADQHDVAASVRHRLGALDGAQGRGVINVTVQRGEQLASELADFKGDGITGGAAGVGGDGGLKRLSRLLETQAVRLVAEDIVSERGLVPAGQRRFYRSLADAFRRMAERPEAAPPDVTPAVADESDAGGEAPVSSMNDLAEELYAAYREKVASKGYYIPAELPHLAAQAVAKQDGGRLPYVIYYLPRRLSAGDMALARALLEQGKCEIIGGLTGDAAADAPVSDLMSRLAGDDAPAADAGVSNPLKRKADAGALRIISAPDPEEEVRAAIRRIAAGDTPLHRIAVIYRQANPYASRLRQELDFAGIPYAGAERRSLADTPTGLLLLGLIDLAAAASVGVIDRERLIEWMTTTSVRWPDHESSRGKGVTVPASRWANLALEARANGAPGLWETRLNAHRNKIIDRIRERDGDDSVGIARITENTADLIDFVANLYEKLRALGNSSLGWEAASKHLKSIFSAYVWYDRQESDEDLRNIEEAMSGLSALQEWGAEYSLDALQDAVRSALQSPRDARGQPVGAGVYVGPPAGIVGLEYDAVYALGMVERQFPPRPGADPWLADNAAERQREAALERYDFLGAVAAGRQVTLCWPAATADRSEAYPSRWLVEAANLLHQKARGAGRLAYDKIATGAGHENWLTTIASREAGLRELAGASGAAPADVADYRMMHLAAGKSSLRTLADTRMHRALDARTARYFSAELTEWDGRVGAASERITGIGSRETPVSPSALETWANCPYRYFLGRVLRLSAPPEDEDDQISALERGLLVHRILEQFVKKDMAKVDELTALAEAEFRAAEQGGVTGHYLLWEVEKAKIREGLAAFLTAETQWFGGITPRESRAEVPFDGVGVSVEGLGEVWFRGTIDRLDVLGDEVRVRDFKTGDPSKNLVGTRGGPPDYTIANGRALQVAVYTEAAQTIYPNADIKAYYCFPLNPDRITDDGVAIHSNEEQRRDFHNTLSAIVNTARAGIFPATPDGKERGGNCRYCDFKRLCPTRRRQIWERKGGSDTSVRPYNDLGGQAAIKASKQNGDNNGNAR